jgi:hypothetical protein
MANNRKKNKTESFSLSSEKIQTTPQKNSGAMTKEEIKKLNEKVFSAVNNLELEKSIDKWIKENAQINQITRRDISLLKGMVSEYMDCYLMFGYNLEGDRIIIQNFKNARDRDAIMEFLKTIFFKQQHENFLDE